MPCNSDGFEESEEKCLRRELDKVTKLLCAHCEQWPPIVGTDLGRWWLEHQELDKERIKSEALAKLTPAERKALGH